MSTSISPLPQQQLYNHLSNYLTEHAADILEVDILPSSFLLPSSATSQILIDGLSLALPKNILVQAFLVAREVFFRSSSVSQDTQISESEVLGVSKIQNGSTFAASAVILLFDPEHLTAANYRKRHLISLIPESIKPSNMSSEGNWCLLMQSLDKELAFLESMLTSPLKRHTKSPTLWHHRYWLFRRYLGFFAQSQVATDNTKEPEASQEAFQAQEQAQIRDIWQRELNIVQRAGERHPRNYYAWHYLRRLIALLGADSIMLTALAVFAVESVQIWCFQHPRDISGWAFLIFLLETAEVKNQRDAVVERTKEWVHRLRWKGKSVEWFIESSR